MRVIRTTMTAALVAAGIATATAPAGATTAGPERVSVDSSGAELQAASHQPSISADGRYAAFEPGLVHDRQTGTTVPFNIDPAGAEVPAKHPEISADGRYVVFSPASSTTSKLVYVRDLRAGTTTPANVRADGKPANHGLFGLSDFSISGNGRYVAFSTDENGVVAGDTNNAVDVFVRDLQAQTTTRVSVRPDGSPTSAHSFVGAGPALSDDGRYVAFSSQDTQLVDGDTNGTTDVFVRDLQTGTTSRASLGNDGVQGDKGGGAQKVIALSGDGQSVIFDSRSANLVEEDTGSDYGYDVYVRDVQAGTTILVAPNTDDFSIDAGALSTDGRYVAYSIFGRRGTGPGYAIDNIYLRDLQTDTTTAVNVPASGGEPVGYSYAPAVSANGDVAFESDATNLVPGDTNRRTDVFVAPH